MTQLNVAGNNEEAVEQESFQVPGSTETLTSCAEAPEQVTPDATGRQRARGRRDGPGRYHRRVLLVGILTLVQVLLAITFSSIGIQNANQGEGKKAMAAVGIARGIVGYLMYLIVGIASVGLGFFI